MYDKKAFKSYGFFHMKMGINDAFLIFRTR